MADDRAKVISTGTRVGSATNLTGSDERRRRYL
jgi:hypothetical protein